MIHNSLHIGEYKLSAKTDDFNGWLLCDGRSLLRSEYPHLFTIIGTSFGSVDSTHFNLPDFRGRAIGIVGDGAGLTSRAIGDAVGSETHQLTSEEMPSHIHTGTTDTQGAHSHTTNATGGNIGLITADGTNTETDTDSSAIEPNVYRAPQALTMGTAGSHSHTLNINSTGGNEAHNNMQPTLFGGNVFIFIGFQFSGNYASI